MKRLSLVLLLVLAGCAKQNDHRWLGYAEGDYAYVSAPQAGWVVKLDVKRGEEVKDGAPLFSLDDVSQTATRDQAAAQIAQAEGQMGQAKANLDLAKKEFDRQQGLVRAHATSTQSLDVARSNYDTASAQVAQIAASENQARAALANAQYQLSQREVVAHTHGRVQDIYFREGEYAPAMTPVLEVLPPENIYVRFFVPESDFARLHLGEEVLIGCDSCGGPIKAKITFIASQEEFTPPVIFSEASRDKLVYKVEARAPGGLKLHPGQPVDVRPAP
jgi:HlyD family secretion protein